MLIFGPYKAIPKDTDNLAVFNLSSPIESIPRLPGLFVIPSYLVNPKIKYTIGDKTYYGLNNSAFLENREQFEKEFDMWYYDYLIQDATACSSLMTILMALYDGKTVYVCISDYASDDLITTVNESFMKFIQSRYDIKYSRINEASDFDYIPKDGCDFMSVAGITTFDSDRKIFMQIEEEQRLAAGGAIGCEY